MKRMKKMRKILGRDCEEIAKRLKRLTRLKNEE
jgi:hypothetical protein